VGSHSAIQGVGVWYRNRAVEVDRFVLTIQILPNPFFGITSMYGMFEWWGQGGDDESVSEPGKKTFKAL